MEKNLKSFLNQYFALEIIPGKKIRIPYWRNKFPPWGGRIQGPYGGKGMPAQIKRITLKKAKQARINLTDLNSDQIRNFMKQKKIGVECSGFTFQVLNFLKPGFYKHLKKAPGISPNPIRRFNAAALTSAENSRPIKKVKEIQVGDLIAASFEKNIIDHVLIIVDISKKEIIYAHSSSQTPTSGPHLGKLKIANPSASPQELKFVEKTKRPLKILGIRRIEGQ
ncbi:MAG: hypothetical protein ABIB61_01000 [Candidatus Shapirobacteria bacterium]